MGNIKALEKLPLRVKLGYSSGEFSLNIVWQTVSFFLPIFYTDTFGLPAAVVGTMFLVVRFFDAFSDFIMGIIADRTNTRWGKFRPYLLWFAAPFGIVAVLMFSTPDLSSQGKLIYAYVTYSLMMIIYTAINIPFGALLGVVSAKSEERTSLSSTKMVFAYLAGLSVQAFLIPMVDYFGSENEATGYQTSMAILGGIAFVLFMIAFFNTKEKVKPDPKMKMSLKLDIKELLSNRPWLIVFITITTLMIYVAIRSSIIMYYFEYYIGDKSLASSFMVIGTIAVAIGVVPTKWLTKKIGKKKLFIFSLIVIVISQSLFFIVTPKNIVLLFALQIIFSLASGPSIPLAFAMIADAADFSEWRSGRRSTALFYAAVGVAFKTGFAIGGAATMWILTYFGYVANVEQSDESIFGMRILLSLVPAAGATLAIIPLMFYNLSEKKIKEIETDLVNRKAQGD